VHVVVGRDMQRTQLTGKYRDVLQAAAAKVGGETQSQIAADGEAEPDQ
jgi:hypothetical protein